jgi:hypothetical protein
MRQALDLYELRDVNPAKIHTTLPPPASGAERSPKLYAVNHDDLDARAVTRYTGAPDPVCGQGDPPVRSGGRPA